MTRDQLNAARTMLQTLQRAREARRATAQELNAWKMEAHHSLFIEAFGALETIVDAMLGATPAEPTIPLNSP